MIQLLKNRFRYQYQQLNTYKEQLELQHLRVKTIIVNVINILFALLVFYFFTVLKITTNKLVIVELLFGIQLLINLYLYAQSEDQYNNLKLSLYVNTLFEYVIAVTLIFIFQTPSVFTLLFLAYATTAIYQDSKVTLLSNISIFFAGLLLTINYPLVFKTTGTTTYQEMLIVIYLFLYIILLSISSYIIIKRKSFFYNNLAKIKESEVRNIRLMAEIGRIAGNEHFQGTEYYSSLQRFFTEVCKKIGIENIFTRKINLLKDLEYKLPAELIAKYPEYTVERLQELEEMRLAVMSKFHHLAVKASKVGEVAFNKKEQFSEALFQSFKHPTDEQYVKIIAFSVFYVLLKTDKLFLKEFDEEKIRDILMNSEYFYLIDSKIFQIYQDNYQVFDMIVQDVLKERLEYAPRYK